MATFRTKEEARASIPMLRENQKTETNTAAQPANASSGRYNTGLAEAMFSKPVHTPELDASVGKAQDFRSPFGYKTNAQAQYHQQRDAWQTELDDIQWQLYTAEGFSAVYDKDKRAEMERRSSELSGLITNLDQTYVSGVYEGVYSRMDENTKALLAEVPALKNERWQIGDDGTFDTERRAAADKRISDIRAHLKTAGYSEEEIDSLFDWETKAYNARQTQEMAQAEYEAAKDRSGAANLVLRSGYGLLSGAGIVDASLQRMFGGKDAFTGEQRSVDFNTGWQAPYFAQTATTQAHNENILENKEEKFGVGSEKAQNRANASIFLNDVGVSALQSAATVALTPMFSAALGPAIGPSVGLMLQGSAAATATMQQAHDMGYSDGQAITMGIGAGAVEYLTEKIGLDNLFSMPSLHGLTGKAWLKAFGANVGKQAATEAGEEALSTIFNTVLDVAVKGDRNQLAMEVQTLMSQNPGMTKEQAEAKVLWGWVFGLAKDAFAGALSGGAFGGAQGAFTSVAGKLDSQIQSEAAQVSTETPVESEEAPKTEGPAPVTAEDLADVILQPQSEPVAQPVAPTGTNPLVDVLSGEQPLTNPGGSDIYTVNGGVANESDRSISGEFDTGSRGVVPESTDLSGERRMDGGAAPGLGGQPVSSQLRTEMNNRGIVNLGLTSQTDGASFSAALDSAKTVDGKHGVFVSPKSVKDVTDILAAGGKVFLNEGGSAGLIVTAEGDIEAVFKNQQTGPKGAITDLMITALANGGKTLDCYGSGLVNKYAMFGFIPVAQVEFNPEYANPGWNTSIHGTPNVYVMAHNGDTAETVLRNRGQYQQYSKEDLAALPMFGKDDYEKAIKERNDWLAKRNTAAGTPVGALGSEPIGPSVNSEQATLEQAVEAPTTEGPTPIGSDPIGPETARTHPINEEGAAQAKANFGRDPVHIPVENFDGHLTKKTASTVINSGLIPDEVAQSVYNILKNGGLSHTAYTDVAAIQRAREIIDNQGFDRAVQMFREGVANGTRGKTLHALGIELINRAARDGKMLLAADLVVDLAESATEQAQAVQVLNLFNKATPDGRFYLAVKGIDNLVSRMEAKYGERAAGIQVDETALNNYYEAVKSGDEQAIKETLHEVQKSIASQIPPNWKDRLNAWRYLAMLGNPKTHIRNVSGNALFMPVRIMKDMIGAGLESLSGTNSRSKAVLNPDSHADKALLQMGWQDYEATMESQMAGKYDEADSQIDREREILPGVLGKAYNMNSDLLQKEDTWFSRRAYSWALAGWMKANGISAQQMAAMMNDQTPTKRSVENLRELKTGETVRAADRENFGKVVANNGDGTYTVHFVSKSGHAADVKLGREILYPTNGNNSTIAFDITEASPAEILAEARRYAAQEARKATYQDINAFSEMISSWGRANANSSTAQKVWATAVSALLPFRRTPANIIVRGVEYSPVYLARGIYEMSTKVKNNQMSASEAIDHISSGLTGTLIMGLGGLLSALGLLTASGDEDEKQAGFDKLRGEQNYALTIGNKSFTIDWMAPEALPLFVGAELYEWWQNKKEGEGGTFQDFIDSLGSLTDPILETSMLSSINDLIDSAGYSDSGMWSLANSVATNYLSSFVPTVLGQAERSLDPRRQETYRQNESSILNSSGQYDLGNLLNKVPFVDYGQVDYVDAWGRTQDYGSPGMRMINQFINPSYVSEDRSTEVDAELQRLYDGGMSGVFPQRFGQSEVVSIYDSKGNAIDSRHLTAEEYVQVNTMMGQTRLQLVSELMDSELYAGMNDNERADAINRIYTYARRVALSEVEPSTKLDKWVISARDSVDPGLFLTLYSQASNLAPYGDNKTVSDWQVVELVAQHTDFEQADSFIPTLMTGFLPDKYELARDRGYSPERFAEFYMVYNTTESDRDKNGKSLGNVRTKIIDELISRGWPRQYAIEMYNLFKTSGADLKTWKW